MKIAIAGAGAIGSHLAAVLLDDSHDVTLIDHDDQALDRVTDALPAASTVLADACEVRSLAGIGMESYDVAVAATGDDEDNLVISLLAKQEFAVPRVLARVNNPKNAHLFTESWGVDTPLSVPHLMANLVEEEVTTGRMVPLFQLRDKARLVEVNLVAESPIIGRRIADLDLPRAFTFVAIMRDGAVLIPRGDTTFHVGDGVLALVTPETEDDGRRLLTGA
jgi:trk system potassium uptake protein TrkA